MLITFINQKACRSHPSTVEINTQIPIHLRNSPYEQGCFSFLFISMMMTSSTYCWGKRRSKSWRLMSFLVVSTGLESFAGLFGRPSCLQKQNPLCPQDEWRMGEVDADLGTGMFSVAGSLSSSISTTQVNAAINSLAPLWFTPFTSVSMTGGRGSCCPSGS